jgi:hypothetical protein
VRKVRANYTMGFICDIYKSKLSRGGAHLPFSQPCIERPEVADSATCSLLIHFLWYKQRMTLQCLSLGFPEGKVSDKNIWATYLVTLFHVGKNKGQAETYLKRGKMTPNELFIWSLNTVVQPDLYDTHIRIINSKQEALIFCLLMAKNCPRAH